MPLTLAVILVGNNPASQVYVANKQKFCADVGIRSEVYKLSADTSKESVLNHIHELNKNPKVHGILLQLPLPDHLNSQEILETIDPLKDVDGLNPYNLGRLFIGSAVIVPCTPQGCLQLIQSVCPDITGKTVTVVGRSNLVGKPLAALLTQHDATVTLAHSKTENLQAVCNRAQILVCAMGLPKKITAEYVQEGAIVIDVGINRVQYGEEALIGDVDFDHVIKKAGFITPVPGGVGPMTIANLLKNTLLAAQLQMECL